MAPREPNIPHQSSLATRAADALSCSRLPTMLLEWCTLEPFGSSHLAAIRFNAPVRVKTIRIFPTGTQPFAQCPDVVACVPSTVTSANDVHLRRQNRRTEPAAFYLDVYFNILPMMPADPALRPKPTNELVRSVLPYAGDCAEFAVDMTIEVGLNVVTKYAC